jgi:ankyrin repeat protein
MAGRADAVRLLLEHGAFVNALDGMFAGTPLLWACEGWSHDPRQAGMDHVAIARLLLAAGSQRDWVPPEKAPDPEGTQERLMELCRAADAG